MTHHRELYIIVWDQTPSDDTPRITDRQRHIKRNIKGYSLQCMQKVVHTLSLNGRGRWSRD